MQHPVPGLPARPRCRASTCFLLSPQASSLATSPAGDTIVQDSLRAGVVINALDAKGLYAEAPTRALNEPAEAIALHPLSLIYEARSSGARLESQDSAMDRFAESTSGLFFHNNDDRNLGFCQLGVTPEVAFSAWGRRHANHLRLP